MPRSHPRAAALLALLVTTAAAAAPGRADDLSDARAKLEAAKTEFDAEMTKFKKGVREHLDRREADARTAGNKKLVEQVKEERAAFEKSGELRSAYPPAVMAPIRAARASLDKAYKAAVKDFVRLNRDAEAAAAEKGQQQFQLGVAMQLGKRTPLASLKLSGLKAERNLFAGDAAGFKIDGEAVPHSVMLHPTQDGTGTASYPVGGRAAAFQARVGIPKYRSPQPGPASAVTFEVLGDGRPLWKSEPVTTLDKFQTCLVNIDGVKTLTLRVSCRDHGWAHAVWFGPTIAE